MAADMDASQTNSKATTASVDRRVEQLEKDVSDLHTSVKLMEKEQQHIKELMSAQFKVMDVTLQNLSQKVDSLLTQLTLLSQKDAVSAVIDESSKEELAILRSKQADHERFIQQLVGALKGIEQMRIWIFGGGIATFLVSLVGLLHALGILD